MLSFLMYADDTSIYLNLEDFPIHKRHIEINRELDKVNTWLNPIRSGLFQTANDSGGGFKSSPLRSRKLFCQSSPYHSSAFHQVF